MAFSRSHYKIAKTLCLRGLRPGVPIWRQYLDDPESVMWVPRPELARDTWENFVP